MELVLVPNDVGLNNDRVELILVPNDVGLNNDRVELILVPSVVGLNKDPVELVLVPNDVEFPLGFKDIQLTRNFSAPKNLFKLFEFDERRLILVGLFESLGFNCNLT